MARLAIASLFGLVVGVTLGAALGSHAQEDSEDTVSLAAVPTIGLLATAPVSAVASQGDSAVAGAGALTSPGGSDWPIGGALGQRLFCVEGIESHHGQAMWNPTPIGHEHASGWLGFLPSTAARWGADIGNRSSEWNAAARMLAAGHGREFYGVGAGLC